MCQVDLLTTYPITDIHKPASLLTAFVLYTIYINPSVVVLVWVHILTGTLSKQQKYTTLFLSLHCQAALLIQRQL